MADRAVQGDCCRTIVTYGSDALVPLVATAQTAVTDARMARDAVRPTYGYGPPAANAGIDGSFYQDMTDPLSPLEWFKTGAVWRGPVSKRGPMGGNVFAVGLFTEIATIQGGVPAGANAIRTSGHSQTGIGGATYARWSAPMVNLPPALSGLTWTTDATGARFYYVGARLFIEALGAIPGGDATDALLAASAYLTAYNGGAIGVESAGATFRFGRQASNAVDGPAMFDLNGLTGNVLIDLGFATFKRNDGGSFGMFAGVARTPCKQFLRAIGCSGKITIQNGVVDGNFSTVTLGGSVGDSGYQYDGDGILALGNTGGVIATNFTAKNWGRDGILFWGRGFAAMVNGAANLLLFNPQLTGNGRQGLSVGSGHGIHIYGGTIGLCGVVSADGFGSIRSAPAAAFDIEPEGTWVDEGIRHLRAWGTVFRNIGGPCLLASVQGDITDQNLDRIDDCEFYGCTFWGDNVASSSHSLYLKASGFKFFGGVFSPEFLLYGANVGSAADPRFHSPFFSSPLFTDSANYSMTGQRPVSRGAEIQYCKPIMINAEIRYAGSAVFASVFSGTFDNLQLSQATSYPGQKLWGMLTGPNTVLSVPDASALDRYNLVVRDYALLNGVSIQNQQIIGPTADFVPADNIDTIKLRMNEVFASARAMGLMRS